MIALAVLSTVINHLARRAAAQLLRIRGRFDFPAIGAFSFSLLPLLGEPLLQLLLHLLHVGLGANPAEEPNNGRGVLAKLVLAIFGQKIQSRFIVHVIPKTWVGSGVEKSLDQLEASWDVVELRHCSEQECLPVCQELEVGIERWDFHLNDFQGTFGQLFLILAWKLVGVGIAEDSHQLLDKLLVRVRHRANHLPRLIFFGEHCAHVHRTHLSALIEHFLHLFIRHGCIELAQGTELIVVLYSSGSRHCFRMQRSVLNLFVGGGGVAELKSEGTWHAMA
mmetsp:Transcript_16758/g.33502  ORF Transcript_16758/g.33502 Transcript_16758/m.33502 type:complete len:279 (-) Transcript_16758:28-864(-)